MRSIVLMIAILGFVTAGCATVPNHPRFTLIDVDRPLGQAWLLTSDEKVKYLEEEDPAECAEFFDHVEGSERQKQIESCLQEIRVKSTASLPAPLKNGFLEVVYAPSGAVIGRSHIFAQFFPPFVQLSEADEQERANVIAYEMSQWTAALEGRYGPALSYGQLQFGTYQKVEESNAPCAVWFAEPVAIFLCRSRPFTPDASQSSLSFVRVDRINQGDRLTNQIIGD